MGSGAVVRRWAGDLLDLLVPRSCCVCGRRLVGDEAIMCLDCYLNMPRTGVHGDESDNDIMQRLASRTVLIERAASWFYYFSRGDYASIIHDAKYNGRRGVGRVAAMTFATEISDSGFFDGIDLLLPVPIHFFKKITRGYNQSLEIARGISRVTGIAIADNLKAARHHGSQTRRNAYQRWLNSRGIYGVVRPDELEGKHVLIVDDVLTTGATLLACAEAIHEASPSTVISVMTLAATHKR